MAKANKTEKLSIAIVRLDNGKIDRNANLTLMNEVLDILEAQEAFLSGPIPVAVEQYFDSTKGKFTLAGDVYDGMLTSGLIELKGTDSRSMRKGVETYLGLNTSQKAEDCMKGTLFLSRRGRDGGIARWSDLTNEDKVRLSKGAFKVEEVVAEAVENEETESSEEAAE